MQMIAIYAVTLYIFVNTHLLSFFSAYISELTKSISGRVLSPTQALSRTDNKSVNWTLSTQITFTFPQRESLAFWKKKIKN